MYVKKPVIENVYDSKILLAIGTNEVIVKQISKITGTHKPTIRRQIKEDLLEEYLKEEILDDRGKTTYSIRWNKIVEDFLNYLKKISKEKKLSKKEIEEMETKLKPMKNNKYLILVLQIMFREFSRIYLSHNIPITIEELFKEMIVSLGENLNPNTIRPKVYMDLKEEKEFSDFLFFNYFLETYFSTMKINIADLFYLELEKKPTEEQLESQTKKK
jgi:hypothetical protein